MEGWSSRLEFFLCFILSPSFGHYGHMVTGMLQNEVVSIHICMYYLLLFWYFLVFRCVVCLDSESLTQKMLVCL